MELRCTKPPETTTGCPSRYRKLVLTLRVIARVKTTTNRSLAWRGGHYFSSTRGLRKTWVSTVLFVTDFISKPSYNIGLAKAHDPDFETKELRGSAYMGATIRERKKYLLLSNFILSLLLLQPFVTSWFSVVVRWLPLIEELHPEYNNPQLSTNDRICMYTSEGWSWVHQNPASTLVSESAHIPY